MSTQTKKAPTDSGTPRLAALGSTIVVDPLPLGPRPARWVRREMGPGWMLTTDGTTYQHRACIIPLDNGARYRAYLRGPGYDARAFRTIRKAKGWAEREVARLDGEGHQWVTM